MFINTQIFNIKWRQEKGKGRPEKEQELVFLFPFSGFRSPDFYFSTKPASSVFAELVPTNTLKSPGSLTNFKSLL